MQGLQKELYSAVEGLQGGPARYPVCVVLIDVPPGEVDVTLDPDKMSVAFAKKVTIVIITFS